MANVPDDTKSYFSQEELPPPPEPASNIDIVPTGSQVTEGDLRSPNFVHDQSGWVIRSDGSAEFANIVTRVTPINIRQYTSSDVWTKPDNIKYLVVEVQAPGGTGGEISSTGDTGASGGGSGGYARKAITASVIGATATITIGSPSSFTDGTTTLTCTSGEAGGQGTTSGGGGGTATGGDININGGRGGVGRAGAGNEISGAGAGSPLGVGGGPTATTANGENAGGYGAGGGGAMNTGSANSYSGGVAGPGIIILTEYY